MGLSEGRVLQFPNGSESELDFRKAQPNGKFACPPKNGPTFAQKSCPKSLGPTFSGNLQLCSVRD